MFGNLFNEMQIGRFDENGTRIDTLNVPISYGPKQRFIERVLADPTLNRAVSTTLPRIAFSMASMNYAPMRKLNSTLKFKNNLVLPSASGQTTYAPVPYDFNFTLSILVKNAEDGTQLIEKILPFFTPDYTVTMRVLPQLSVTMDVPIELIAITSDDSYEGDFDTSRRVLTWDLQFIVKGYLWGPVTTSKYITEAEIKLFDGLDAEDEYWIAKTTANTAGTFLTEK
jgi:hypothetical protein